MTQDTRKDRRVKIVSLNVRYKSATVDEFIENHALDVSRGGIYIKTNSPFSPGTLLKFEIRLASDQAVILGVGRVVWKRDGAQGVGERPPGMGVKFIKVDDASKTLIDRLVNARADAGSAFEAEPEAVAGGGPRPIGSPAGAQDATRVGPGMAALPVRHGTIVGLGATGSAPGRPSPAAGVSRPAGTIVSTRPPPAAPTIAPTGTIVSSALPPAASSRPQSAIPAASSSGANSSTGTLAVPVRPSAIPGMFPGTRSVAPGPPKQEQTVMRQAAELLEEALREAGGSMDDMGTTPLFSGMAAVPEGSPGDLSIGARSGSGREARGSARGDEAEPVDDAAHARAMVAAMAPAPVPEHPSPGDGRIVVRDPFHGEGLGGAPARRISIPPPIHAADAVDAHIPRTRPGSAFWLFFGALAAIVIVGVAYSEQLFGPGAAPSPSASTMGAASAAAFSVPSPSASSVESTAAPSAATGADAAMDSADGSAGSIGAPSGSALRSGTASSPAAGPGPPSHPTSSRGDAVQGSGGAGAAGPPGASNVPGGAAPDSRNNSAPASAGMHDRANAVSSSGSGAAPRSSSHSSEDNPY